MDRITNRPEFTPASGIRHTETTTAADPRQKTSGPGFQEALRTAMTPMTSSSGTAVQGTLPPLRTMPLGDLFESSGVEMRIQDLIQTMEQFSAALMNPEQTLKELTPMADALGEEAESLFRQSPDSENPVQDFARRTALLARVEVEKFRRGDFL